MSPAPICGLRLINACCFQFQASLYVFSRISWRIAFHECLLFWANFTFYISQKILKIYNSSVSNKFQLVYIFQNIIKRRDISLMSVLLSKFPDISFTYNVLQNIMRREFQIISSISSKLQVLLFVFPECNTRSCISLMSAVLSSPVLLKLEGKVGEEMWFKGRSGTGISAHWAQWLLTSEVRRANAA